MPKRPQTGQERPVCGPRREREAQGTLSSRSFFCDERALASGRRFFGYFLVAVDKKVTRLKAEIHGFRPGRQSGA
jgi:hypothetical protein